MEKLLAIWFVTQYKTSGKDIPLRIIELGPGRGTLMADILRVRAELSLSILILKLSSGILQTNAG